MPSSHRAMQHQKERRRRGEGWELRPGPGRKVHVRDLCPAPLQTEHLFDERPFKTVRARRRLHRPCEAPRCRRRAGGVLGSTGGRDSPISPPRVAQLVSVSCFNMNGYGPQLADVNACTAEFEANAREAAAASSKLAAVAPAVIAAAAARPPR